MAAAVAPSSSYVCVRGSLGRRLSTWEGPTVSANSCLDSMFDGWLGTVTTLYVLSGRPTSSSNTVAVLSGLTNPVLVGICRLSLSGSGHSP